MKRIYTLGTGLRSLEDFFEIVIERSVEAVIDVRSYPAGKIEHFRKTNLASSVAGELLEYHDLGSQLGGFRKGGYERYSRTREFEAGIHRLVEIASQKPAVIICAEHFPWKCHRRFIARALQHMGREVIHIIDKGEVWSR